MNEKHYMPGTKIYYGGFYTYWIEFPTYHKLSSWYTESFVEDYKYNDSWLQVGQI